MQQIPTINKKHEVISLFLKVCRHDWIRNNHIKFKCCRHCSDVLHQEVTVRLQSAFIKHELSLLWRRETKIVCKWYQGNDQSVILYGNLVPFIKYFPNAAVSLQMDFFFVTQEIDVKSFVLYTCF